MKKLLLVVIVLAATVFNSYAQKDSKEKKAVQAATEETVLKAGMNVPDFNVPSIKDPKIKYSKEGMLGKIYIIDFWASWCGPCVNEMKVLHAAYEKFKSKGLDIISFSCDVKPEDVAAFRKDKWAMPWKHIFFGRGKDCLYPKIKEEFGIKFIPSPFLIGKDGKILAMGDDLRGEKLIETLGKYFK